MGLSETCRPDMVVVFLESAGRLLPRLKAETFGWDKAGFWVKSGATSVSRTAAESIPYLGMILLPYRATTFWFSSCCISFRSAFSILQEVTLFLLLRNRALPSKNFHHFCVLHISHALPPALFSQVQPPLALGTILHSSFAC